METSPSPVDIFEYDNYRSYLKDWYLASKKRNRAISFRNLSRLSGLKSPNFFKLVMDGERNLSHESIDRCCQRLLKLKGNESDYFRNLVLMNQSVSTEEKAFYAQRLVALRPTTKAKLIQRVQYAYYSNWYYIPVRELVAVDGFREDPRWIAAQLLPPIQPFEAQKAIEDLLHLGLLRRDDHGKLVQEDAFIKMGDEVGAAILRQFHREMIKKGAEAVDLFSKENREISGVTLALSRAGAEKIKKLIHRFRSEICAVAEAEKHLDGVYQVNFQLFPLAYPGYKEDL